MADALCRGYTHAQDVGTGNAYEPKFMVKAGDVVNFSLKQIVASFSDLAAAPREIKFTYGDDTGHSPTQVTFNLVDPSNRATLQVIGYQGPWTTDPVGGTTLQERFVGPGGEVELFEDEWVIPAGETPTTGNLTLWVRAEALATDKISFTAEGVE